MVSLWKDILGNVYAVFALTLDHFVVTANARVMVLAATNRPSELDEAILRRLPQAFEIGLPDRRERAAILKVILKGENVEDNIDYDYLASLCEGYTGSDLLEFCKKAAYFPIRDLLNEEKNGKKASVSMLFNLSVYSSFLHVLNVYLLGAHMKNRYYIIRFSKVNF